MKEVNRFNKDMADLNMYTYRAIIAACSLIVPGIE